MIRYGDCIRCGFCCRDFSCGLSNIEPCDVFLVQDRPRLKKAKIKKAVEKDAGDYARIEAAKQKRARKAAKRALNKK